MKESLLNSEEGGSCTKQRTPLITTRVYLGYCTTSLFTYCVLHYARVAHAIALMIAVSLINLGEEETVSVTVLNT